MKLRNLSVALFAVVGIAVASCSSSGTTDELEEPVTTISGPVTGGQHGFPGTATPVDLAAAGYTEQEYFFDGTATAYEKDAEWEEDGKWAVRPTTTSPYTSRMLVRAPKDPSRFNGTVLVEWLNVSGNADVDVDFAMMHDEILRGYAWVGISAQAAGINSPGPSPLGDDVTGLKDWDPERYDVLDHPGDAYSYDIFTQAGQALESQQGVDPLPGLDIKNLIATGQSQSAFRMLTYANAVQPIANVYDGLIVHSRSGDGAPLGDDMADTGPAPAHVRSDLQVPVFQIETETDMYGLSDDNLAASFPAARQPDTDKLRTWEIAGTSHSDATYLQLLSEQGSRQYQQFMDLGPALAMINNGPQSYVNGAALRAMRDWVTDGTEPAQAEPFEVVDDALVRDEHGNVIGGVRTPQLDVPVATLTGEGAALSGRTIPFDEATLTKMYPTHDAYVSAFSTATTRAIDAGFMLADDEARINAEAQASTIGR